MKKVVITAANSFIGKRLCLKLTEDNYFVYAVVRKGFKDFDMFRDMNNISVKQADMSEYDQLPIIIEDSCDYGIALAWDGTRAEKRSNHDLQAANYNYSMSCVQSFIKMNCNTIMTAGSQAEYGPVRNEEKVKETDECHPNTEYGKFKLKFYEDASRLCRENNVRIIEPRFFSLYGADDNPNTMIVSMTRNMLQNKKCELTQCIQLWDFLYIDDAINALKVLLESDSAEGVFNFGSGKSYQLKYYVETMHKLLGSSSELIYGAVDYPPTGMVHTNPSIKKLTDEIGWHPQISFEEGIEKVRAYQSHILSSDA